jgi:signal transduction histidine kinase
LGYGLFIAVLVGLVVYQVVTINRMQSINRTLSGVDFQKSLACLQALRDRDLVEEYAWKSFALADPDYLEQLREFQKSFEGSLSEIKNYTRSDEELDEVKRVEELWDTFTGRLEMWLQDLPQSGTSLPQSLQNDLELLRTRTYSLYQSSMDSMSEKVEKSRQTAETAGLVLWLSTFIALAISILVSFLIYRSISKPLAHLTEGTRAIAEGKFFYRLDSSRKDEFSQLAKDFNTMTYRLNELDELKKGFVAHVSHELKSPLASMQEATQLLVEELPGPLIARQKRLLELNLRSIARLRSMISNLLDLSKMEAGLMEYDMKKCDLVPLVQSAVAELEVQAGEKQVQVRTEFPEAPLQVECDSGRIVQVVVNLVGNAVKFSPKESVVEVRVETTRDIPESMPERWQRLVAGSAGEGSFILVTVADSGPGIPDADKDKIFERFRQIRQAKKAAGQGAGLGLSICRIIAQAHRGAIWVEDNPGGGSRFLLLLPPGGNGESAIPRASQPI